MTEPTPLAPSTAEATAATERLAVWVIGALTAIVIGGVALVIVAPHGGHAGGSSWLPEINASLNVRRGPPRRHPRHPRPRHPAARRRPLPPRPASPRPGQRSPHAGLGPHDAVRGSFRGRGQRRVDGGDGRIQPRS